MLLLLCFFLGMFSLVPLPFSPRVFRLFPAPLWAWFVGSPLVLGLCILVAVFFPRCFMLSSSVGLPLVSSYCLTFSPVGDCLAACFLPHAGAARARLLGFGCFRPCLFSPGGVRFTSFGFPAPRACSRVCFFFRLLIAFFLLVWRGFFELPLLFLLVVCTLWCGFVVCVVVCLSLVGRMV